MNLSVIYASNFREVVPTLRKIADSIEAGEFGEVNEMALVIMGDKLEVFGAGPTCDGASIALLLQAGAHRMIREVVDHGR